MECVQRYQNDVSDVTDGVLVIFCELWTYSTLFSSVYTADFKQVNFWQGLVPHSASKTSYNSHIKFLRDLKSVIVDKLCHGIAVDTLFEHGHPIWDKQYSHLRAIYCVCDTETIIMSFVLCNWRTKVFSKFSEDKGIRLNISWKIESWKKKFLWIVNIYFHEGGQYYLYSLSIF